MTSNSHAELIADHSTVDAISAKARSVRLAMQLFSQAGQSDLSIGDLERITCLCKRSVHNALDELVETNLLVDTGVRGGKTSRTTVFKIAQPEVEFGPWRANVYLARQVAQLGCSPLEKSVLLTLACHANGYGEVWPSLGTLERITGYTDRGIRKALRRLCVAGHLVNTGRRSGKEYRDTFVYVVKSPVSVGESASGSANINILKDSKKDVNSGGNTSADTLPCGQKEAHEEKEHKEDVAGEIEKEEEMKPSEEGLEKPVAEWKPFKPQKKTWPNGVFWRSGSWDLAESWFLGSKDSGLVQAWKRAHQDAGLVVPAVSAIQGAQLRQLGRGKNALDYAEVRDVIIPCVVANWKAFLGFCLSHGVHNQSKAPFPVVPSAGFLLRHKRLAKKFRERIQQDNEIPTDKSFLKHFLWTCLHHYSAQTGALSKKIPAPILPKLWNSPIWKDRPKEHKKLTVEEMYVPSTWNGSTETDTLSSLCVKGVPKDRAIAVLKYVRSHWVDFRLEVQSKAKGLQIQAEPHPHLLLAHWNAAETVYEESLQWAYIPTSIPGIFKAIKKSKSIGK